jgi:flagellar motor switch protein FliN
MHRGKEHPKTAAGSTPVFRLREFDGSDAADSHPLESTSTVAQSRVTIVLGRTRLTPAQASSLHAGSLVVLEQETADPVEIFSGGRLLGLGEVVVIDEKFCVRVVELNAAEQAA